MAYYPKLVTDCIGVVFSYRLSKLCVFALISFLLSALVGGPARFSSDFNNVEDIAARLVLLSLSEGFATLCDLSDFLE